MCEHDIVGLVYVYLDIIWTSTAWGLSLLLLWVPATFPGILKYGPRSHAIWCFKRNPTLLTLKMPSNVKPVVLDLFILEPPKLANRIGAGGIINYQLFKPLILGFGCVDTRIHSKKTIENPSRML